jgi:hypothetical protein
MVSEFLPMDSNPGKSFLLTKGDTNGCSADVFAWGLFPLGIVFSRGMAG